MKTYVDINAIVVATTARAVLLQLENEHQQWVPLSVIEDHPEADDLCSSSTGLPDDEEEVNLLIEEWFAIKEGLA